MIFLHIFFSWLTLISLAICIGILFFRVPLRDRLYDVPAVLPVYTRRITALFLLAVSGIVVGSVAELAFRTAEMAGQSSAAGIVNALPVVLFRSHYGKTLLVRCVALILLAAASTVVGTDRRDPAGPGIMLLLFALVAWSLSAAGHAADAGDFTLQEVNDLLHLLAASVWGGGVFVLAAVILPYLFRKGDVDVMARVSARFSRVAGPAVAVLMITALVNARFNVGSFELLWTTAYGLTVLAKMVLLYFLLLIGGVNRYIGVPILNYMVSGRRDLTGMAGALASKLLGRFHAHLSGSVAVIFLRVVTVEALIMALVFLAAAVLKNETPSRHLLHMQHREQTVQTSEDRTGPSPARRVQSK